MGHSAALLTAESTAGAAASSYVLHVVPANGGGVDRYVRDICAHRRHDCILHVVPQQCVFEAVAAQRLIAIDDECTADASVIAALGRPLLLHAHSCLAPVREYVALLTAALGVEYILTLHDIDFAGAYGQVDDTERAARMKFALSAAQRVAPSAFIARMLAATLGPEAPYEVIENGVDVALTGSAAVHPITAAGHFEIAVVGALGPHKGLNFLHDIVAALPSHLRVVIIGYADGQITPGWLQNQRVWVHGAFEPRDLPSLIRGYATRIALFPNRQAESYSYALSDVWNSGLPALGPASGAIGERIVQTGAGWTYAAGSSAEHVAARLVQCLTATESLVAQVRSAAAGLHSTQEMVESLNKHYEKMMRATEAPRADAEFSPQIKALEAVAATQLNGHFFRGELTKLSGDLAFSQTQAASANQALQSLTKEYEARAVWIAALENSLAECRAEITRIEAARITEHEAAEAARINDRALFNAARQAELAEQRAQAEIAHTAHERYAAKLQQDVTDTLAVAHQQQQSIVVYERLLAIVPPLLRRPLLARAKRLAAARAAQ